VNGSLWKNNRSEGGAMTIHIPPPASGRAGKGSMKSSDLNEKCNQQLKYFTVCWISQLASRHTPAFLKVFDIFETKEVFIRKSRTLLDFLTFILWLTFCFFSLPTVWRGTVIFLEFKLLTVSIQKEKPIGLEHSGQSRRKDGQVETVVEGCVEFGSERSKSSMGKMKPQEGNTLRCEPEPTEGIRRCC
jgi:hypothetical protein